MSDNYSFMIARVNFRPYQSSSPIAVSNDFVLACARLLARLPLKLLHPLGAVTGWAVYVLSPSYRRRLRANLTQAVGAEAASRLWPTAVAEAGRQALELSWVWLRPLDEALATVRRVEGLPLLEEARGAGQGILFLTPHMGCFEIISLWLGRAHPITVLYRPPRKPVLGILMQAGRGRGQVKLAPTDLSGVRKLIKGLRDGEAVGMLPDQVPAHGEGTWAPVFGRPAWTMTLAARLSEVKGVRVILTWAERLPRGEGYVIRLSEPVAPLEGDTLTRTAALNREVERLILQCPQQYLWGYHRYKRPGGVPPPDGGAV